MLRLSCGAQCYEWGRPADKSEVASLAEANGSVLDPSKPYAELWMGMHPNCPNKVAATGQLLSAWIAEHPESVGQAVQARFGAVLPFLFKVLSVNKALSIQSHPDKQLAEKLHREFPKMYADDNHKPEMALALSDDFQALCAFAPVGTILAALQAHPELAQLVGQDKVQALEQAGSDEETVKQALRAAFTQLMTAPQEQVAQAVSGLVARLQQQQQEGAALSPVDALALRLDGQYPGGDVGVLASFFLNFVCLRAGQALYLGANEPHAYLQGELVECMASSDNVIRAGLTPKFKHADVLCQSLTYRTGLPEVLEGEPLPAPTADTTTSTTSSPHVRVYRPPTEEFEIRCLTLPATSTAEQQPTTSLAASAGPQLLLVQSGAALARASGGAVLPSAANALQSEAQLARGMVLLVPAGTRVDITPTSSSSDGQPLRCWVAAVNATFLALHEALAAAPVVTAAAPVVESVLVGRSEAPEAVCVAHLSAGGGTPSKQQAFGAPAVVPTPVATA